MPRLSSEPYGWSGLSLVVVPAVEAGYESGPAGQQQLCVSLVTSGALSLEQRLAGGDWKRGHIRKGDLFIVAPQFSAYELRWESPSESAFESTLVLLDSELLRNIAHELLDGRAERIQVSDAHAVKDAILHRLILELRHSLDTPRAMDRLYVESAARKLAAQVLRHHSVLDFGGTFGLRPRTSRGGLPPSRIRRIEDFVTAHLGSRVDRLGLDALAAEAELSAYHFARLFTQSMGESPHAYVLRRRVEKAMALLRETSKSIIEVGLEVGFTNHSHFTMQFRKIVGSTPSAYRRR